MKHKLFDKQKLSLILVIAALIAVTIFGYITAPDTYKHAGNQGDSGESVIDGSENYDDWFEDDWSDDPNSSEDLDLNSDDSKKDDSSIVWDSDKNKNKTTSGSSTTTDKKRTTTTTTNKKSSSTTTNKNTGSSTTNKKPSTNGNTSGNNSSTKPTDPEKKPDDNNNNNNNNDNPTPAPAPEDTMKWPDNTYTNLVPKPTRGVVQQAELKDGIFCILMTGADMVDAKSYAASLINAGYTSDITETIENNNYLFGGGSATGSFVVISYQNGQFIIGIEK